ncbi:MAG TPA: hypothetical protein VGZ22_22760, partial [Isosphaeraceae bacterium]|nr:hypothetical protein [Isosphaeraceae bacterium]
MIHRIGRLTVALPAWVLVVSACVAIAADTKQPARKTTSFQTGVGGYEGTVDIELWALAPTTVLDTNPNATSDANNDGGESQILLR